jgi:hypothetical protein
MDISNLGNFRATQRQTSENNEEIKDVRTLASVKSQVTTTEEAKTSPIPPVNQTNDLSGEEGNTTNRELETNRVVDLLA